MKRLFDFIQSLSSEFISLLGYPTVKFYSDVVEVYFDCSTLIKDLSLLTVDCDAFRMFANDGVLTIVYTFNLDDND